MTGGYVMYKGSPGLVGHKVPGGYVLRDFPPNIYVYVGVEDDFKWFQWKAGVNNSDWDAKRRMGKNDVSLDDLAAMAPKEDLKDPNWDAAQNLKAVRDNFHANREEHRQARGRLLPKELLRAKGIRVPEED